ncbi:UNVERIFIED_CONTAM: Retrovirus-related Pol polyprotein from transposon RE2 [Sesamum indicum]
MLDPLPNVEKAFSMIFSVEQQRAIHTSIDMNSNNMAYQLNLKGNKREDDRYAQKKKFIANKRSLMCSHCHKPGHGQETCFQLHGVPDWYKSLNDRKKKGRSFAANIDAKGDDTQGNAAEMMNQLLELLRKANVSPDPITNHANFAQFEEEFAGNVAKPSCIDLSTWIIDTGATNHVCASIALFHSFVKPVNPHFIYLPDGSRNQVQYVGMVKLNDDITLNNVFFVPHFSVNLISVSQLCSHTDYQLHFTKDTCFLQDLENKTTKSIAHLFNNLYIFRQHPSCFTSAIAAVKHSLGSVNCTSSLWHKRLGHASLQAVKRLVDIDLSILMLIKFPVKSATKQCKLVFLFQLVCLILVFRLSLFTSTYGVLPLHLHPDHTQPSISQHTPSEHIPASTPVSAPEQSPSPVVRRSSRVTRRPLWLDDFVSVTSNPHIVHPSNAAYTSFVAPVSILQEPKSFQEATRHQEWIDVMKAELTALEDNHTWIRTPLPAGKKPIRCKWVYKTKLRADGSVERYKARLVAKGFTQIPGVDYTENFSPVEKPVTVRVFLSIAAAHNWPLQQMNVNNVLLHGYLEEDLYMKPPEGYPVQEEFGFTQSAYDHCFFTKKTDNGLLALLVYVDDIIVTTPSLELIQTVKDYLHSLFTIKDLSNACYFLGLEIARSSDGLYLAQTKYVRDIIKDTGMSSAKSVSTPFPLGLKLTTASGALLSQPNQYRRLIGRLLYLGFTRPEISHSVQQLSQFLTRPCDAHWRAALHVVRYLKGEPSKGLFFPATYNFELTAYCDADWASCTDSRRSLTGYCIFLGAALVSWKTKKQSTVSRSTAEAEYRSMAATVCELKWLSYLLSDFDITLPLPVRLFCDNQAALHIMLSATCRHFYEITASQDVCIFTGHLGLAALHPSPTCGGAVELGDVLAMEDKAATATAVIEVEDEDDVISFLFDGG